MSPEFAADSSDFLGCSEVVRTTGHLATINYCKLGADDENLEAALKRRREEMRTKATIAIGDVVRLLLSGGGFARSLRSSKARDSYETWTHWDLGLACHRRCLFLRGYLPS